MKDERKTKEQLIAELNKLREKLNQSGFASSNAPFSNKEDLEGVPDAIIHVNEKGIIELVNKQAETMFGYKANELIGQHLNILISKKYHKKHELYRKAYTKNPEIRPMSNRQLALFAIKKDGTEFPVEIQLGPIKDTHALMVVCTIRDISRQRQTENYLPAVVDAADELLAVKNMDMFYRRAVELAREKLEVERCAIFLKDKNSMKGTFGTDRDGNTTNEKSICMPIDAIWEKRFQIRQPGDPKWSVEEEEHSDWNGSEKKGKSIGTKGWIAITPIQSSTKPVQIFGAFTNDAAISGDPIDNVKQDVIAIYCSLLGYIAQRKQAEAALEKERAMLAKRIEEKTRDLRLAMANLKRADQLKDEFLANMSHDLRTPLNNILSTLEVLDEGIHGPINEKQREYLKRANANGRHLLMLMDQILDLSKIRAGKLELKRDLINIEKLCDACLQFVRPGAYEKELKINTSFDSRVTTMVADELRMKQILINLLSNAVKYTPAKGSIGLNVSGDKENNLIQFIVWDTGVGISCEEQRKIFDPFYQAVHAERVTTQRGIGLGLSLTYQLVDLHNGGIEIESKTKKGSRFIVSIPWKEDFPSAKKPGAGRERRKGKSKPQALIIEDSAASAEQIQLHLTKFNIESKIHPYGNQVIDQVLVMKPSVILLDICLPDVPGWTVLQTLKDNPETKDIPIIIVSVLDDKQDKGRELGAVDYLVKPITHKQLELSLKRAALFPDEKKRSALLVISNPKILLVEDNEDNIKMMSDYLNARGFQVSVARNGHEGLEHLQKERPDLILMDITMPGMDGFEAIRSIRNIEKAREIPIIAVTALAMTNDRDRCLNVGADEYMSKPVKLKELVEKINHLFSR